MLATAPPTGTTRRCTVHKVYANGVLVLLEDLDDRSGEPYVAVLDLDNPQHVAAGSSGTLLRVDAGWRGAWAFQADG